MTLREPKFFVELLLRGDSEPVPDAISFGISDSSAQRCTGLHDRDINRAVAIILLEFRAQPPLALFRVKRNRRKQASFVQTVLNARKNSGDDQTGLQGLSIVTGGATDERCYRFLHLFRPPPLSEGSDDYLDLDIPRVEAVIAGVLIDDNAGNSHLFVVLSGDTVFECKKVQADRTPSQIRSPESRALAGKAIGIVGLGSAGSKIAISLARMGARKFYLVDHDVLLPENLQRHALDWQGVLEHKVDALAAALCRLAPESEVQVCRLDIAGQESNAAVAGALDRLAQCDVIIDATANPRVFNLLAAVARTAERPMIWMEIFGGGMGGLVARSRPHVDPTPQDMRGAYLQYCDENPDDSVKKPIGNYGVENEAGEVLVASDADVAIIAQHATRFVTDCLISPEQSKFPYSMYLLGLAKGWVFEAPFMTIPISMASQPVTGWSPTKASDISSENAKFLLSLCQKPHNATAHSA